MFTLTLLFNFFGGFFMSNDTKKPPKGVLGVDREEMDVSDFEKTHTVVRDGDTGDLVVTNTDGQGISVGDHVFYVSREYNSLDEVVVTSIKQDPKTSECIYYTTVPENFFKRQRKTVPRGPVKAYRGAILTEKEYYGGSL